MKVERRLLRYQPGTEAMLGPHPREDCVVTGWFDGWDTLNSMLHFVEEMLRPALIAGEAPDPILAMIKAAGKAYLSETGIEDVLELFEVLKEKPEESFEAQAGQAVARLFDYFSQEAISRDRRGVSDVVLEAKRDPILAQIPEPLVAIISRPRF